MKNILFILAFLIGGIDAYGATAARGSARGTASHPSTQTNTTGAPRAARTPAARSATKPASVNSRSATTVAPKTVSARSAKPTVAARAAKQSVISSGTKVAAATQNTAVDEECWNKFSGCMDSFCMLDNASGGRCICSDKNAEYDSILAEIQDLDNQSYQMATVGVERIEMGDDADAIMNKTKEITSSIEKEANANASKSKRKSLNLESWNSLGVDFEDEMEDIFTLSADGTSLENKKGDALYRASVKLCSEQLPACSSQSKMMELMYQQRIRSDCSAYENSLRQQRLQSAQKLASAQSAMREAALEQYRNANKYDLGQCTIEFKKCMQTTAGCGDDFTGCVTQQTTRDTLLANKSDSGIRTPKVKQIKGASTTIEIAAWTYDTLEAKKPLCMTVTQQCVNVKNQVWDTFLREVAPQLKTAELTAESNLRTSCISTISDCFQKACKDNIDPNNPDGSYDMCLTRPETMRAFCKVQIDPCEAAEPKIMDYVSARLLSMRVDSCTKDFKECLQSEDRCGPDYTQCIGLHMDSIIDLCPMDKLVSCQYDKGDLEGGYTKNNIKSAQEIKAELETIARGIFLNIDNNLLSTCQKAAQTKVLEVCGSLTNCEAFDDNDVIGTDSLVMYKKADQIIIDGLMDFGLLKSQSTTQNGKVTYSLNRTELNDAIKEYDMETKNRILASAQSVENQVKQKLDSLATDPTIDMCINGRSKQWNRGTNDTDREKARFPNLLDSYSKMIFSSGLDKAYINYRAKYDEFVGKAVEEQSDDIKAATCAAMAYKAGSPICTQYNTDGVCAKYKSASELTDIFDENMGESGLKAGRYVIYAAKLSNKLDALANAKSEFVQTDGNGNMMGLITIMSTYSPGTNICTLKTTTTMCKDVETIITTDTDDCGGGGVVGIGGGCGQGGIQVLGGYGHTTTTQNYQGIYCSSYGEPVETVTEIKM